VRTLPAPHELYLALSAVPSFRAAYNRAIPLAVELIGGSSVSLDGFRNGVLASSFLINLEAAFEGYIRNSINHEFRAAGVGVVALDGNKRKWSGKLFKDSPTYEVKPDLIFKSANEIRAIGDVKYKIKAREEDRYQIISHALSFRCKNAVLIYPASTAVALGLRRVGAIGPANFEITLFEYGIPLDEDLEQAERSMAHALGSLCCDRV
jgi:5-methylcytosine-specific restriction enzyme subunit McrC